jgi:hypothetical protein
MTRDLGLFLRRCGAYVPGLRRLVTRGERKRHLQILQHDPGRRPPTVASLLVPDKVATADDVAIAGRLLDAFRAATRSGSEASNPARVDVWTIIASHQARFASILGRGDPEELAGYLCNVSRHDASEGITQGHREYDRIVRDGAYRDFLALMAKDKLVSLAEAVGSLPVENPEQGPFGVSLHTDPDELVATISQRLGVSIAPPDIDGGLLKLETGQGLFGERDANAIFTAHLLRRVLAGHEAPRICEIGGGSGRAAYWSQRLGLASYTIIDLPHVNVVQGYYLLKSLAGKRVVLYGEQTPEDEPAALVIWPNHAIAEIASPDYDLVLNQDSMPEMNPDIVDDYLRWIRLACRGLFMSINHESRPAYGTGLRHVSVPEAVEAIGGFERQDRFPYWLRRGYVVELYRVS